MGFLGPLLGRTKLRKGNRENYFSIITAGVSFDGRTDIRFTEKAGLVFSPVESSYFDNLDSELRNLLKVSEKATDTCFEIMDDGYGTRWVLLDDPDFEDLATALHMVGEEITDHGFGDRIIAAVFGVDFDEEHRFAETFPRHGDVVNGTSGQWAEPFLVIHYLALGGIRSTTVYANAVHFLYRTGADVTYAYA